MPNSCPSGGRLPLKALWVRIEKFGAARRRRASFGESELNLGEKVDPAFATTDSRHGAGGYRTLVAGAHLDTDAIARCANRAGAR
jgi:hypothetical protein